MYSNIPANTGFLSTSLVNGGTYEPFRISLDYQKLLNIYRGSWIIRAIVDTMPEDMLKDFPALEIDADKEDIEDFDRVIASTHTLQKLIEGLKWGRLFGGAIALIILAGEGQRDLSKPLDLGSVPLDSYRGLIIVDRWSGVSPSSELVSDIHNPAEYGLPKYYQVTTEVGQNFTVHHSRVLRFIGRDLPLFEKQIQTYWGMSEIECVYEDMRRYDFTLSGIADLVSRAHVLVMKEPMLAQMLSGVGLTQTQMNDYLLRMKAVSESISTNGVFCLGKDGELQSQTYSFGGLSDIGHMFMLQMCGAAGYPMSRLFGQTHTGLGQSGEGDLQTYYDAIDQKRKRELRPIFDKLIPIICMSTFGEVPGDLDYAFPAVRSVTEKERADLAAKATEAISGAYIADLITKRQAVRDLARSGELHGMFQIPDEDIQTVPEKYASEMGGGELELPGAENGAADSTPVEEFDFQGLQIAIETPQGTRRNGPGWQVEMPADYGFIDGVMGADGDELDCYVGPSRDSSQVFVVDQLSLDGKSFDEHKVMLGFGNQREAENAYRAGHHRSAEVFSAITPMTMREFKAWMRSGDLTEPAAAN